MPLKLYFFVICSGLLCFSSVAQTVWNGPTITFAKAAFANPSLAANQDRITANTWITRGNNEGLFNAASEADYQRFTSPDNTEWATGSLANYATLTYQPWATWAGRAPNIPAIVGKTAVVHLISENIYLTIKFLSWGQSSTSGGFFSYERSTAGIPAPVKLVSFSAARRNNTLQLAWKTASEENTSHFSIERSSDGKSFAAMGTVKAAGNSTAQKDYSFTDATPLAVGFYRLRTTDKDESFSFSPVVVYRFSQQTALQVFPNPASQVLYLQRNDTAPVTAQITDAGGRTVKQVTLPADSHTFTIDIGALKPGLYFLKAGDERRQFVKQ